MSRVLRPEQAEGASFLAPGVASRPSEWTEASLTESGRTVRAILQGWAAADGGERT